MDALTPIRLRARLAAPGLIRRLAAEARAGGPGAGQAAGALAETPAPRPDGPLVWLHAPDGIAPEPVAALAERLEEALPGAALLLTGAAPAEAAPPVLAAPAPAETPRTVARFLARWRPDVALWSARPAPPLLLDGAARRGLPLALVDAGSPEPLSGRARKVQRLLLGRFDHILARDAAAGEAFRRLGLPRPRVEVAGPLTRVADPPPCNEAEREDFAHLLRARPVWLAACPDPAELDAVLAAHRAALRIAHRLLLILVTEDGRDDIAAARRLREEGWILARRNAEEEPAEATEIYLVHGREDLGLWYRLAPVTFLGGTLAGGAAPPPLGPASLGSAILAGPESGGQAEALGRLERGGALRRVAEADALPGAVIELLQPDRSAELAHRAWDIASDGAAVERRLTTLILTLLRRAEG